MELLAWLAHTNDNVICGWPLCRCLDCIHATVTTVGTQLSSWTRRQSISVCQRNMIVHFKALKDARDRQNSKKASNRIIGYLQYSVDELVGLTTFVCLQRPCKTLTRAMMVSSFALWESFLFRLASLVFWDQVRPNTVLGSDMFVTKNIKLCTGIAIQILVHVSWRT